ncbi:MAG: winged helix-turn-helix transcriptional regulator [Sciscionella sp.]
MTDVVAARAAIALISSKWAVPVLEALEHGPRSYNELSRAVDLDHKSLDRTLRRLRRHILVERGACRLGADPELRVRYRLTPRARGMLNVIDALGDWWRSEISKTCPPGIG